MADDLLSRIQGEISERKQAARAAYEESRRLEAALAALDVDGPAAHTEPKVARSRRGGAVSRRPRGENRQRIVDAVADRPGASAGQIAEVTGIQRATVASTLAKLVDDGVLERVPLPARRVGFRTADRQSRTASSDVAGDASNGAVAPPAESEVEDAVGIGSDAEPAAEPADADAGEATG